MGHDAFFRHPSPIADKLAAMTIAGVALFAFATGVRRELDDPLPRGNAKVVVLARVAEPARPSAMVETEPPPETTPATRRPSRVVGPETQVLHIPARAATDPAVSASAALVASAPGDAPGPAADESSPALRPMDGPLEDIQPTT